MSLTPLSPSLQESAPLAYIFCLTGQEWSLTCWAEIKGEHCNLSLIKEVCHKDDEHFVLK